MNYNIALIAIHIAKAMLAGYIISSIIIAIGICNVYGGNLLTDAFGIVATAGAIPIVCIQLVGLLYKFKTKNSNKAMPIESDKEIIDIDWVWANE